MTINLKAENIFKSFENGKLPVLSGINLTVKKGESVAIVGKSGSGKSTLLHILGTLETPSSGSVTLLDGRWLLSSLRNQKIGFIFQSSNLLDDYTLLENVLLPAQIGRRKINPEKALQALERVGLKERSHALAKQLSGGEKQRGAIARALFNDPEILFADEPSGNLEKKQSEEIHKLLMESVKGKSLVLVTHEMDFALLCDKIYLLENGKLTPGEKIRDGGVVWKY